MIEIPSMRPETRYGIPTADLFLFNRKYIVGYSYLFRQPRWAMELIDPEEGRLEGLGRLDNFRDDLRIPEAYRATLGDYRGSGYDRGHLISSADRLQRVVVNSETFLMSNMSPQHPRLNRQIWRLLEDAVRGLAARQEIVEVYAVCGPLFTIGDPIEVIGDNKVVVPDAFFKSVLAEDVRGDLSLWSFAMANDETANEKSIAESQIRTDELERWAGLQLWDRVRGMAVDELKSRIRPMWEVN